MKFLLALIFAAKDNSQKFDVQIIKCQKIIPAKISCYTVYGNSIYGNTYRPVLPNPVCTSSAIIKTLMIKLPA